MKAYFHKVAQPFQSSFLVRHDIAPNFGRAVHYHTDLELHLTLKGEGVRFIGDKVASFEAGDILLLGENLPHAWRAREKEGAGVEAVIIQFKKDCFGRDFFSIPELAHIRNLYDIAKKGVQLNGSCRQQVETLMMQALTAEHFKRILILLEILHLIADSKEYGLIASTEAEYKADQEDACRLDRVHAYTLEHFKREISLAEIAGVCNLSITSFCRYFKSTTKTTYFDFLIQVRVNFACRMIIEDRYSIATICFECGFNNVANFYRHFKKLMLMTPVEYKRKYAKEMVA